MVVFCHVGLVCLRRGDRFRDFFSVPPLDSIYFSCVIALDRISPVPLLGTLREDVGARRNLDRHARSVIAPGKL